MKKIVYFNLDVGSGIQIIGDEIRSMLDRYSKSGNAVEIIDVSQQTCMQHYVNVLEKEKPDIIIMNEIYRRVSDAVYAYKALFKNVKVLVISHLTSYDINGMEPEYSWIITIANKVINVGYPRSGGNCDYIDQFYPPVADLDVSKLKKWPDRKPVCYVGRVIDQKFSIGFVESYDGPKIDIYGSTAGASADLIRSIKSNKNMDLVGEFPHENVFNVFGGYKASVFPCSGPEVWCLSLLESIKCGTIPFVINEACGNDRLWTQWADGMIYEISGCSENNVRSIGEIIRRFTEKNDSVGRQLYLGIAVQAIAKYPYSRFEQEIKLFLDS